VFVAAAETNAANPGTRGAVRRRQGRCVWRPLRYVLGTAPRPGRRLGYWRHVETATGDGEKAMSSQEFSSLPVQAMTDLASAWLKHLEQEEAVLLSTLEAL